MILDWRALQADPPPAWKRSPGKSPRAKIVGGKVVRRDLALVTSVMLHQTDCVYGVSKSQIIQAGGDPVLARNRRLQGIPAHLVAARDGTAILNAPASWYLYHGNAANDFSLGVEVEGSYDGRRNKGQVPTILLEQLRLGLIELVRLARAEGAVNLRYAIAHRQSNGGKPGDPGCELWQFYEALCGELELEPQYDLVIPPTKGTSTKPGRPIPKDWSPKARAPYL